MGTLKPGATYIYERVDNTVYSREFGADPSTRKVIGYSLDNKDMSYYKNFTDNYFLQIEWAEILKASETNPTLQEAIERVKLLYHLSLKNGE